VHRRLKPEAGGDLACVGAAGRDVGGPKRRGPIPPAAAAPRTPASRATRAVPFSGHWIARILFSAEDFVVWWFASQVTGRHCQILDEKTVRERRTFFLEETVNFLTLTQIFI